MTRPDDFLQELDELESELTNLSVQQKVVQPREQEQVAALLARVRSVIQDFRAWQHAQGDEERLIAVVEELRRYTGLAHRRLEYVESSLGNRDASRFRADPKILAEGEWVRGMLAGPPTDDAAPRLLMDAPRPRVRRGLDELAAEMLKTSSAREVLKGAKK